MTKLWMDVLGQHPHLSIVDLVRIPRNEASVFSPGNFNRPEKGKRDRAQVTYGTGNDEYFSNLKRTREVSARLVAELLEIPYESLTPNHLRLFIFLHECGHADDFVLRYLQAPDGSLRDPFEATNEWEWEGSEEMRQLPIPNLLPGELRMYAGFVPLPDLVRGLNIPPDVQRLIDAGEKEKVLELQERAYKNTRMERAADTFAAEFMKKNSLI